MNLRLLLTKNSQSTTLMTMPIEFTCPHCQAVLRVDDTNAGKRARCPHCNVINRIPGDRVDEDVSIPSQEYLIDSVSGQTFGPVNRAELNEWASQGRISASCVIRESGKPDGQTATEFFPSLSFQIPSRTPDATKVASPTGQTRDLHETAIHSPGQPNEPSHSQIPAKDSPSEGNPYAAPETSSTGEPDQPSLSHLGITPTTIEPTDAFTISWHVFINNLSLLFLVALVCGLADIVINAIVQRSSDGLIVIDAKGVFLGLASVFVLNLIKVYLVIGQMRVSLKLIRGEPTKFSDLFDVGDKFLPVVGWYALITIPLLIGFGLLIVPGIFISLYIWTGYMLIIDRKTGVFDSFGVAIRIGEVNLLNSFIIGVAGYGLLLAGGMLCYFGFFLGEAYVSVLFSVAYLMMTGQLKTNG